MYRVAVDQAMLCKVRDELHSGAVNSCRVRQLAHLHSSSCIATAVMTKVTVHHELVEVAVDQAARSQPGDELHSSAVENCRVRQLTHQHSKEGDKGFSGCNLCCG
jgi:hypothetical protein